MLPPHTWGRDPGTGLLCPWPGPSPGAPSNHNPLHPQDLFSALIKGPTRTPYEDGLYLFDIQLPNIYPAVPPHFCYLSQCSGRLNPNLYDNGKVCVSLLGTWIGKVSVEPASWLAGGRWGLRQSPSTVLCLCCRGQRGGRASPAFCRCSSPSKVRWDWWRACYLDVPAVGWRGEARTGRP